MGLFSLDKIVWLFSIASWLSVPAFAQVGGAVDEPSVMTLQTAQDLALQSNADLAVALRELQATDGAVMQGAARPNPELAFLQEDLRKETRTSTLQLNQ